MSDSLPQPPAARGRFKPLVRRVLTLALVGALAVSAMNVWHIAVSPVGTALQARGAEELAAAWDRTLARAATPEAIAARIEARLAETPRNWVAIAGLEDLAAAQGVPLPEATRAERDRLHALDHGWARTAGRCAACALDLRACELSVSLSCGLVVQFSALGDLISLGREASNYAAGRDVDGVDLTLSFIGLGAAGLVVATRRSAAGVKLGAALLKTAHAMGRLHPDLVQVFRRAAREGVDWAGVPQARSLDDLARLERGEALRPALEASERFGDLLTHLGPYRTLSLAAHIDSVDDARQFARMSEVLKDRTLGALDLLGKSRFLRVGLRWADEVWALIAGLMTAFAALVALFWSALASLVSKRARRWARA